MGDGVRVPGCGRPITKNHHLFRRRVVEEPVLLLNRTGMKSWRLDLCRDQCLTQRDVDVQFDSCRFPQVVREVFSRDEPLHGYAPCALPRLRPPPPGRVIAWPVSYTHLTLPTSDLV